MEDGDEAKVQALLNEGADVNTQEHINGHFALQYAINRPDVALVKLLLEYALTRKRVKSLAGLNWNQRRDLRLK